MRLSTCHKHQTTKLHLILTSNVQIEIGKVHVDTSKVQNYKTTPDFVTRYINFIYVFNTSYVPNYKTTPDFDKQCSICNWKGHDDMSEVSNYKTTPDFDKLCSFCNWKGYDDASEVLNFKTTPDFRK